MMALTDKIPEIKTYKPDSADELLYGIWALGCDYNGENTVEGLKNLIDTLVDMSQMARDYMRAGRLFSDSDFGLS